LACPVFFVVGEQDFQTQTALTEKYYALLKAPQKNIFTIKEVGHLVPYEKREAFQQIVIDQALPLAK